MNTFTFNEKTHRYFLDGKPMTGVTTVLGVINKPALVQWAANCAVDYIMENGLLLDLSGDTHTDLPHFQIDSKLLKEARTAHTQKRDKAADAGTDVHGIIEGLLKSVIEIEGYILPETTSKNLQVQGFIDWAVKNKVCFTSSEGRVYSTTHFTAGTYDFTCEMDGLKYVGDLKTTSSIYDRTPFAQCAAYQMMLAEMQGKEPSEIADRRLIINLKKTGTFDEEKDVYISEHYEDDIELFMSALTMYRNVGRFEALSYLAKRK